MEPSDLFSKEIDRIVREIEARFGTPNFVAVHFRTEVDWVAHCRHSPTLFDDGRRCFVDDTEVEHFLRHEEQLPTYGPQGICSTLVILPTSHHQGHGDHGVFRPCNAAGTVRALSLLSKRRRVDRPPPRYSGAPWP